MSVSAQETVFYHVGNGVSVTFAFNCQVLQPADLHVYIDDVLTTSGFTISGIGALTGGTVTFGSPPANLAAVRLEREVTLERTTDYQQNGDFLARVVNPDFNRIWMALQQQFSSITRAIRAPKADTTPLAELPRAALRANKLLSFDSYGNPVALAPIAQSATALSLILAAFSGSSVMGFIQAGIGAQGMTVEEALRERVSATQFMTPAQRVVYRSGDLSLDLTVPIQKAIDFVHMIELLQQEISEYTTITGPKLYFPYGRAKVSGLTGYQSINWEGERAVLVGFSDVTDIVKSSVLRWMMIRGMVLIGGKSHVNVSNANYDASRFNIDECELHGGAYYPLATSASGGYTHLSATFHVTRTKFMHTFGFMWNVCDYAIFEKCDLYPDRGNFSDNMACFVNAVCDGNPRYYMKDCTGVPTMGVQGVNRRPRSRWFDQRQGDIILDNFRAGGEDGGMPLVYFSAPPSTSGTFTGPQLLITGGECAAGPQAADDSAMVVLVGQVPQMLTIRDVKGPFLVPYVRVLDNSVDPATYFTNWEAATGGAALKAYNYFKFKIEQVLSQAEDFTLPRVPRWMSRFMRAKQTMVKCAAAQALVQSVNTALTFDTVEFDNFGAWVSTDNTKIAAANQAQRVQLACTVNLAPGIAQGVVTLRLYDSSANELAAQMVRIDAAGGSGANNTELSLCHVAYAPLAGEFFQFKLLCTSVGGATTMAGFTRASITQLDQVG